MIQKLKPLAEVSLKNSFFLLSQQKSENRTSLRAVLIFCSVLVTKLNILRHLRPEFIQQNLTRNSCLRILKIWIFKNVLLLRIKIDNWANSSRWLLSFPSMSQSKSSDMSKIILSKFPGFAPWIRLIIVPSIHKVHWFWCFSICKITYPHNFRFQLPLKVQNGSFELLWGD